MTTVTASTEDTIIATSSAPSLRRACLGFMASTALMVISMVALGAM